MPTPVPDANLDTGGTDNAAPFQSLLDAGRPLPPGCYGIASTLDCSNFVGKDTGGAFGGVGGPDNPTVGTWLVWQGPPGGTLLRWRGMKGRLRDVALACARSTSLDRCIDVEKPDGGLVSTSHLFERVACDGRFGPVGRGWVFGEDQSANGEFMRLVDSSALNCTYAGVHVPSGTDQAEFFRFQGFTFSQCLYGYAAARSSAYFDGCNFSWCGVAAQWFGGTGRPIAFRSCDSEGCKQFLSAWGCRSVRIESGRLNLGAALSGPLVQEWLYGGQELILDGVTFEQEPAAPFVLPNNNGNLRAESVQFNSPMPFASGGGSYRLKVSQVRLADGAAWLPDGEYYMNYPVYPQLVAAGAAQPLPAAGVPA